MKKEFHSIQLINSKTDWKKDDATKSYVALKEGSSIFVQFAAAEYKMLVFKKDHYFQVEQDYINYDESIVTEKSV